MIQIGWSTVRHSPPFGGFEGRIAYWWRFHSESLCVTLVK
jgi:hypothetical protein